jgi:hypothetical protein
MTSSEARGWASDSSPKAGDTAGLIDARDWKPVPTSHSTCRCEGLSAFHRPSRRYRRFDRRRGCAIQAKARRLAASRVMADMPRRSTAGGGRLTHREASDRRRALLESIRTGRWNRLEVSLCHALCRVQVVQQHASGQLKNDDALVAAASSPEQPSMPPASRLPLDPQPLNSAAPTPPPTPRATSPARAPAAGPSPHRPPRTGARARPAPCRSSARP